MSNELFRSWREAELERKRSLKKLLPTAKNPCTNPKKLLALATLESLTPSETHYFWRVLMENPSFPAEGVRHIWKVGFPANRNYFSEISVHPNTPDDVLKQLLVHIQTNETRGGEYRFNIVRHPNISWETFWNEISRNFDWIVYFWEVIHFRFPEIGPKVIAGQIVEKANLDGVTVEGVMSSPLPVLLNQYKTLFAPDLKYDLEPFALADIIH